MFTLTPSIPNDTLISPEHKDFGRILLIRLSDWSISISSNSYYSIKVGYEKETRTALGPRNKTCTMSTVVCTIFVLKWHQTLGALLTDENSTLVALVRIE